MYRLLAPLLLLLPLALLSQSRNPGLVTGRVIDAQTSRPVEYANMVLLDSLSGKMVNGVVSDSAGKFTINGVPPGSYKLEYSFIGYDKQRTKPFTISRKQPRADLGTLSLKPSAVTMDEVTVTGEKATMITRIDRKVFNIQKEIQSQTGTVTDLLQTIPSVSVDMDGNISLRGSGSVTILINGRPSVMAGAANLEQMPASLIERIEVITNPSAKYKPDGTAGIINIILKKERKAGYNTVVGVNVGNNSRFNGNLQGNVNTGSVNIFGSYGYRQDYRMRTGEVHSQTIDSATGRSTWFDQNSSGDGRTRSHLAQLGADWTIGKKDATGLSGTYNYRNNNRTNTDHNTYSDSTQTPYETYTRTLDGKESEQNYNISGWYEHTFDREREHVLRIDAEYQQDREKEDDYWTNDYTLPAFPQSQDHTVGDNGSKQIDISANYSRPLSSSLSLETGYQQNTEISDQDQTVQHLDPDNGTWVTDTAAANRFGSNQTVYALYATVTGQWAPFSAMLGLRAEETTQKLDFRSLDTLTRQNYFAVYPTLHLSLASGKNEWQLNYSRRVNRPNGEDMNPVPEYRDPRNYYVGNPNLKPEDIHSLEFGYSVRAGTLTFVPTLFYRYKRNGFTRVVKSVNDTVLETTIENLSKDQSAGLDLSGTWSVPKVMNLNFGASAYYNQIDASNIGYGTKTWNFSWNAKLNASFTITKTTVFQVNGQYRSEVLTPQGFRKPSWVVNLGFRQDFWKKRLSFIATVSDLFNSQSMRLNINTPTLVQETTRRRDARVIYGGLLFNIGSSGKKQKEAKFEYDNGMERN